MLQQESLNLCKDFVARNMPHQLSHILHLEVIVRVCPVPTSIGGIGGMTSLDEFHNESSLFLACRLH